MVSLSSVPDRWVCNVAGNARRDCLPTRLNLSHRGVVMETVNCPTCGNCEEDVQHIFFRCDLARDVLRGLCRWWEQYLVVFFKLEFMVRFY
ncbi:RNA-directed DNA polymerase, eukaryota, partial [Tanacetum coccineum]